MKATNKAFGFNMNWLIGGILALLALSIVLFLTIQRLQNLQTTLPRPQAAGRASNSACFDDCFKNIKPGNGSYCTNYCANGGNVTPPPAPTPVPTPPPTPIDSGNLECGVCGGGNTFSCATGLICSGTATTVGICEKPDGSTVCGSCSRDNDCLLQAFACDTQIGKCVPSAHAPVRACWGNPNSIGGRCYDCYGDGEINSLDFSCFSKHWLENVQ